MAATVSPEILYLKHQDLTIEIAKSLTWKFASVGATPYKEDIESEAKKGLWEACQRFKPDRQGLACKTNFWNVILSNKSPSDSDPYETFWSYAKLRIHGSVRDFLRKERIITRQSPNGNGAGSMILEDRFVSTDVLLPHNGEGEENGRGKAYSQLFESKDHADAFTEDAIAVERLVEMVEVPVLDANERGVLLATYLPPGLDIGDVAAAMNQTEVAVKRTLKSALLKMLSYHANPVAVSG